MQDLTRLAATASRSSRFQISTLSALFALSLTACGHQATSSLQSAETSLAQSQSAAARAASLASIVDAAARGDGAATARLRKLGPSGLAAVLTAYDETPVGSADRRARLSAAIDAVARQRDARASRLFWYTDLEAAKREAQATGKAILSLRLLGQLDEELSCANSRFFRTALYPNRQVNDLLREQFVLHWSSERPAPVVTIDFRDGRTLKRTVTGNSLHYVLDNQGRIVDAIPGLWGPQAFARVVGRAAEVAKEVAPLSDKARKSRLVRYHEQALSELRSDWPMALAKAGMSPLVFPADVVTPSGSPWPPPALVALDTAPGAKAVMERPMVREFIPLPPIDLKSYLETVPWRTLAQVRKGDCHLDEASVALMRDKRPRSFMDANALGRPLDAGEFEALVRGFETSMAEDTVKNGFLYHSILHRWLLDTNRGRGGSDSFAPLNRRIYSELFRTPAADPWLGLVPPATFAALQDDGIDL